LGEAPVKSLDVIVFGDNGSRLVVDVKGRRFPAGRAGKQRRVWECWSTQEDIDGLRRWVDLWGAGYQGLLVFCYHILHGVELSTETEDLWTWRGRRYLLRAVEVNDYQRHMRVRSPKWGTVTLPRAAYRELVQPFYHYTRMEVTALPGAADLREEAWNSWEDPGEYEDNSWR
jgi:hypothetical protein